MSSNCEICAFENPKLCATALVMRDNKLLVVKRNEEPFKTHWDFVGGYVQKNETPEEGLRREIKEELGVDSRLSYIGSFTGTASYKDNHYPILSMAYLAELDGDIKLNEENSAYAWMSLAELKDVAFDSNQKILAHLRSKFIYDVSRVKELVAQLDSSAIVDEQSLYKAMLDGYISKVEENGRLVGMGWIFPRQTLLRRQAVVEDMIVDESQRGRGLGEKILIDLLRWAKKEGVQMVELTTNPKRIAANALYQKVGFRLHITNHYLLDLNSFEG
jgi:8-oxo-dGTP diphosphatase